MPKKQKLIKINKLPDGLIHMGWTAPGEGKVLWKTTTNIKVWFTEKKVLYFETSFTFQIKSFMTEAVIIDCCANQWTGLYMITASVMKESSACILTKAL